MSAWASPTQFQQAYSKPVMTLKGGAELQRALLQLARNFGDKPVEDILYDSVHILYNSVKPRIPTNTAIMRENGIRKLPSGTPPEKGKSSVTQKKAPMTDLQRKIFLLWVNRISPGTHEIRDALHVERGVTDRPKVYCALHYLKAHHIFWIEYGKFGFKKHPYMRPALISSRRGMKYYIIKEMRNLALRGMRNAPGWGSNPAVPLQSSGQSLDPWTFFPGTWST